MKQKHDKKRRTKPRGVSRTIAKIVGITALVALGTYASFEAVDSYYTNKFDRRLEDFRKSLGITQKVVIKKIDGSALTSTERIKYMRQLESMERRVDDSSIIRHYIDQNVEAIERMTEADHEKNGIIELRNGEISLAGIDNILIKPTQYMKEIQRNDFTHANDLVQFAKKYPMLFTGDFDQAGKPDSLKEYATGFLWDSIMAMQINATYDSFKNKAGSDSIGIAIGTSDETMEQVSIEDIQKSAQIGQQYFDLILKIWSMISTFTIDDVLKRKNAYARFHTHPKDDPNYFPSDRDSTNTIIYGPNILFSQRDDTLHAYAISRGRAKEILTRPLSHQHK